MLSPSCASVYATSLGTSFDRYKSQNSERICLAGLLLYMYLSATRTTRRCEQSAVWRNYLSTCLSLGRSKPTAFVRHTQY